MTYNVGAHDGLGLQGPSWLLARTHRVPPPPRPHHGRHLTVSCAPSAGQVHDLPQLCQSAALALRGARKTGGQALQQVVPELFTSRAGEPFNQPRPSLRRELQPAAVRTLPTHLPTTTTKHTHTRTRAHMYTRAHAHTHTHTHAHTHTHDHCDQHVDASISIAAHGSTLRQYTSTPRGPQYCYVG